VTFLVGLGETGFSGRGLQDPILLDGERREISPELPTSTDRLRQDLHSLAVLLSSLRGRVVLSYSSYDILEERAAFPSSLVLQAHRLIRGDPDLDYSDLDSSLPEAAGFLPNEPSGVLDETDWWFFRLGRGGRFPDGLDVVRDNFPELRDGLAAVEARNGETLTAHEGIVRIDPGRHDPVTNHGIVLSASRLEQLAKCPYGYFLRYVLKIEPPERLEFDPSRWLDPKQRGLLIHEVLCEFMSEVRERGEAVDPGRHRPLMEETADRVVDSWRRSIPPPSEAIFAGERKEVRETLDVFLVSESRREEEVEPLEFEKRFAGVEIPVGRGRTFLLRGVIDRIDRVGPGAYRIVDYKTGSPGPFERLVTFGGGRIIQHALYAVAAEDLLRREAKDPRPRVTESGYYFPTRRGEGREIMVRDFDREALRRLLADMLDLVARGYFLAGPRTECERCDLSSVCGGAAEARRDKSETDRDVFEAYERLKRYE
jgi:ATP-dependent helicase/nuclease subunit B